MQAEPGAGEETESGGGRVKQDKSHCIWKNTKLLEQHHRMIWWMIDAGAMRGVLDRGWQRACMEQMGCTQATVGNRIKFLVGTGALKQLGQGQYVFNPEFFASAVPEGSVRVASK